MNSSVIRRWRTAASLIGVSLLCAVAWAVGAAEAPLRHAPDMPAAGNATPTRDSDVRRSPAQFAVPHVTLVRDDGKSVDLAAELDDGRPVVVNFIYTSCTTICPMSSQVFEQFQEDLGSARDSVHLVSISIDPEQDTPARLRAYAAQFHAAKSWNHYSGTLAASVAVQRAFNAYRGDKMSHVPLVLVRAAPGKPWIRLEGFARADDLIAEHTAWTTQQVSLVAR
jgi:protein SCO1/2